MKAYIGLNAPGKNGQPSALVRGMAREGGIGAMVQPGFGKGMRRSIGLARDLYALRKTFAHWAFDNGAFAEFLAGREWPMPGEATEHLQILWSWTVSYLADACLDPEMPALMGQAEPPMRPDFIVLPDIVGGGRRSLELSFAWLDELDRLPSLYSPLDAFRFAVVVQEGIEPSDLPWSDPRWHVVFVGGKELAWKDAAAVEWAAAAHEHGRTCHVGRVGGMQRVRDIRATGADSLDSGGVAWSVPKLENWIRALHEPEQRQLDLGV